MKMRLWVLIAGVLLALSFTASAVPPAYEGQFGNPEEPALRPVKWAWLGVTSFFSNFHAGLKKGAYKDPAAMTTEGAKGAAVGGASFVEHVATGLTYAPVPRKGKSDMTYEQAAMMVIERETAKACPEEAPCCAEEKACEEPPAPKPAPSTVLPTTDPKAEAPVMRIDETPVQEAQRRYAPLETSYRGKQRAQGKGNLLKLAK